LMETAADQASNGAHFGSLRPVNKFSKFAAATLIAPSTVNEDENDTEPRQSPH